MLEAKELDKLYQILNSQDQTLQEIEEQFLVVFNENQSVFKASFALNNLINNNLLTLQQRIITIFLLIQNYKSEGIKKHPFGTTILSISEFTLESFERRMIADLLIDGKRQKYSKAKLQQLFQEEELMMDAIEERPQIKKLRDQIISNLPKISQTRKNQLFNISTQTKSNKGIAPPEEFAKNSIKESEVNKRNLNIGVMRPIPTFIEISPFQLNWLSPGIIADVHWDNSVDVQKKLSKCKGYIKKGFESKLTKQESTEIDRCLENQAYAVLNLDITADNLILLINNNPFVAVSFLTKLGNYPIIGDYLESILDCNISLNCIDVVVRLIKASKVPGEFIEAFMLKNLKQSQSIAQNNKQRGKMARIISNFIKVLARNKIIDLNPFIEDINTFSNHFKDIEEAQFLNKLIFQHQILQRQE